MDVYYIIYGQCKIHQKQLIFCLTIANRGFAKKKAINLLTVAGPWLMARKRLKGRKPFELPTLLAHLP
jgi:hypothetical protein